MKILIFLFTMVFAVTIALAQSNDADINTNGNNNTANISQTGSSNDADINQTANLSTAQQTQSGISNEATIMQLGQWPAGPVVSETAIQSQTGNNHYATISQITDSNHGGSSSQQTQSGQDQDARAFQYSWNSTIVQNQTGPSVNWLEAYQKGNNNFIRQIQNGEGNRARVDEQTGGWIAGSFAIQEQVGNWNTALIEQYDETGGSNGNNNRAEIYQTGSDNWAGDGYGVATEYGIRQWGEGNTAIVTQNDIANKSELLQVGSGNTANVTQGGGTGLYGAYGIYWNHSDIDQIGDGNTTNVTQTYIP